MPSRKRKARMELLDEEASSQVETDSSAAAIEHFKIPQEGKKPVICERRGNGVHNKPSLIFTHGAGGGLGSTAMVDFADGFAQSSQIVSFQGSLNLSSRLNGFREVTKHETVADALGGRSMGARAAVLVASEQESVAKSLVLVNFPLVGEAKGESREQNLLDVPAHMNVLFVVGDRDSLCTREHLQTVIEKMAAKCWLLEVVGADHGMNFRKGIDGQLMRRQTGVIAANWLRERSEVKTCRMLRCGEGGGNIVETEWEASSFISAAGGVNANNRTSKRRRMVR